MPALCVECDAELNLIERARIGQRVVCPSCGVQLEVISARPLELDVAYDDGNEWDDMDGYGVEGDLEDDDLDEDDLDDIGRIEGLSVLEEEDIDDLEDEFDDDLEAGFEDEYDAELDDVATKRTDRHP